MAKLVLKIELDSLLDAALIEEFVKGKQLAATVRVATDSRSEEPQQKIRRLTLAEGKKKKVFLTPAQVRDVYGHRERLSVAECAQRFGVSRANVDRIYNGQHVHQKRGKAPEAARR